MNGHEDHSVDHSVNGNGHTNGHDPPLLNGAASPTPAFDLASELPQVLNDLIPLSFLVERVVSQAYMELATLVEILPSTPDAAKKRAIVDYVLQTRRQVLKLLVLVRWSSEAGNVAKCMNIVGFLSRQNYAFDRSIESLTAVKAMLAGARVRNYDIPTAVSVLTTGTYTRLPSLIQEMFTRDDRLRDEQVIQTMGELDDVIRWRLACVEVVPKRMLWKVGDGRATIRVPEMWEGTLTYGGANDDPTAEWYLLSLTFLFRVRDARGVWSSVTAGDMKDHIIELCNSELARQVVEKESEESETPLDTPLVRGYNFLQRLALCYQLEAIYTQALQLSATAWVGTLKLEFSQDRRILRIDYWVPPAVKVPPQSRQPATQPVTPPHLNALTISIGPPIPVAVATSKAVAKVVPPLNAVTTAADVEEEPESRLTITWSTEGLTDQEKSSVVLELDGDLDLESLLARVAGFHANVLTRKLYTQLLEDLDSDDLELVDAADASTAVPPVSLVVPDIHIHLYEQYYITCTINQHSGRLELKAVGEVSTQWEARLRNAADKVDRDRKTAAETISRVRASAILDEVDTRASYLGLRTVRRLPIRTQDLSKFGTTTRTYLFIHLPSLPSHYLVLVLTDEGFRFALISVKEGSDSIQTWLCLEEIGWLDKVPKEGWNQASEGGAGGVFGLDVSIDDLRDLHLYCVHRIASFKIEQQLHLRRIPYKPIASSLVPPSATKAVTPQRLSQTSPYLVVQSVNLLQSPADVAYPNVALQSSLQDQLIRTTMSVRFKDLHLVHPDPSSLPSSILYDQKTSIVTFTSDDIETCIPSFLSAYAIIARSILTAQHATSLAAEHALLLSSSSSSQPLQP